MLRSLRSWEPSSLPWSFSGWAFLPPASQAVLSPVLRNLGLALLQVLQRGLPLAPMSLAQEAVLPLEPQQAAHLLRSKPEHRSLAARGHPTRLALLRLAPAGPRALPRDLPVWHVLAVTPFARQQASLRNL